MKEEFSEFREEAPVPPAIEQPKGSLTAGPSVEFLKLPELRRLLLLDAEGRHIVQLQQDRFIFNWKRSSPADAYPSFDVLSKAFEARLADFELFLTEINAGAPTYRQFEVTYVNHVDESNGLDATGVEGVLADHCRESSRARFLPPAESFRWATAYPLPNDNGRLHMLAYSAMKNGAVLLRLDVTARGVPASPLTSSRKEWFDLAHDWITRGFADATSAELQKKWGRTS